MIDGLQILIGILALVAGPLIIAGTIAYLYVGPSDEGELTLRMVGRYVGVFLAVLVVMVLAFAWALDVI